MKVVATIVLLLMALRVLAENEEEISEEGDNEIESEEHDSVEDAGSRDCPGFDPTIKRGPCYPRTGNPFDKPRLIEILRIVLPETSDPRFPMNVELHGAHVLPRPKKIVPWADPNFVQLHYRSRGDVLPHIKRLDGRPGPLYSFEARDIPCGSFYTFGRYIKPPPYGQYKRKDWPKKPYTLPGPCTLT